MLFPTGHRTRQLSERLMFAPTGLFRSLPCPNLGSCTRNPCPYSHDRPESLPKQPSLVSVLRTSVVKPTTVASSSSIKSVTPAKEATPRVSSTKKRPADDISSSPAPSGSSQPPRKVQKVEPKYQTTSVRSYSKTDSKRTVSEPLT